MATSLELQPRQAAATADFCLAERLLLLSDEVYLGYPTFRKRRNGRFHRFDNEGGIVELEPELRGKDTESDPAGVDSADDVVHTIRQTDEGTVMISDSVEEAGYDSSVGRGTDGFSPSDGTRWAGAIFVHRMRSPAPMSCVCTSSLYLDLPAFLKRLDC